METKEQKQYYITVKGQKVPVSEEVYIARMCVRCGRSSVRCAGIGDVF